MMRWFFLLCALLFSPLFAQEEIIVHLTTQKSLHSLYLKPLTHEKSGFDHTYVRQLQQVLIFDLNHNGQTRCVTKQTGSRYFVDATLTNKRLVVRAKDLQTGQSKGLEAIKLTGTLAKDRRTLHQIADAIHLAFFGTPGIADTRILYTIRTRKGRDSSSWLAEVWEADYDGHNARQLTHENALSVTPTFVPATPGKRPNAFLYVSYKQGQPKIYASSLTAATGTRLTYLKGNQLMPVVSPKQDAIAFICDVTGNPDLFIQRFSPSEGLLGNPRQIFRASHATQGSPTFSPNGLQLAFVSNKDGTPRIYTIDIPPPRTPLKTVKATLISKCTRGNTSPAWSPDGKKIAYSSMTQGVRQIWMHDLADGQETQLTDGPGHKENPTWAPNSCHLLFNSDNGNQCELYLINLNQKEATKISRGAGEKRFPAWELIERKV